MPDIMYNMFNKLWDSWDAYMKILMKADQMFQIRKEEMHNMVLYDLENFKRDCKEFEMYWEDYKKTASKNKDLISTGLYKALASHLHRFINYDIQLIFIKFNYRCFGCIK